MSTRIWIWTASNWWDSVLDVGDKEDPVLPPTPELNRNGGWEKRWGWESIGIRKEDTFHHISYLHYREQLPWLGLVQEIASNWIKLHLSHMSTRVGGSLSKNLIHKNDWFKKNFRILESMRMWKDRHYAGEYILTYLLPSLSGAVAWDMYFARHHIKPKRTSFILDDGLEQEYTAVFPRIHHLR